MYGVSGGVWPLRRVCLQASAAVSVCLCVVGMCLGLCRALLWVICSVVWEVAAHRGCVVGMYFKVNICVKLCRHRAACKAC
jgi:hypothetical protein